MRPMASIGAGFSEVILGLADLLKGTSAPGAVALALFVATSAMMLVAHVTLLRACSYPRDLTRVLKREQRPITRDLVDGLHIPLPKRNYGFASARQMRVWSAFLTNCFTRESHRVWPRARLSHRKLCRVRRWACVSVCGGLYRERSLVSGWF